MNIAQPYVCTLLILRNEEILCIFNTCVECVRNRRKLAIRARFRLSRTSLYENCCISMKMTRTSNFLRNKPYRTAAVPVQAGVVFDFLFYHSAELLRYGLRRNCR